jgi:hypothetical protein
LKRASTVHAARDADLSAVLIHEPFADRQTQTWRVAVRTETRIEKVLDQIRRNPAAGVGDLDQRTHDSLSRDSARRDVDPSADGSVANRIANKVEDNLAQPVFVACDRQSPICP